MLAQAGTYMLKAKMQALKDLYASRHYTQCASFGERLLGDINDKIHPIHSAYLNFYIALSHDTLAREATLKNRYKELNAAEKYYNETIVALTPPSPSSTAPMEDDDQPLTPDSATIPNEQTWFRRSSRVRSFDSTSSYRSSTSSTDSYAFDLEVDPDLALRNFRFPSPPGKNVEWDSCADPRPLSRHIKNDSILSPLSTEHVRSKPGVQLPSGTPAFVRMVEGHLTSVRTLKETTGVRGVRFAFPTPSPSPTKSQFKDPRSSCMLTDEEREKLQQKRKNMTWRPRFNPESVQKLCSDALAELS
ncbi:hypothetical protein J4E90_004205 [Alternaria incomplexa]|uniref:uncharacterized protein n=1 Tax=Alternaria incomplexa TaxID=1187928 RepID=UPI0022205B00|nr:uncharacterized protein J4E90_004205 [Alternaria incomplexa]XP_051303399.1 uncharacterized protein J4E86_004765 [Alternaria arbusti]KAI4915759.1 hypothetical protein J4E90_004205 [Alternaria incomplexa]KAI4957626.1 hypothetical protein J4E86_004765 [Alternaria arbusti]